MTTMMTYEFQVTLDVAGDSDCRVFSVSAPTLASAVGRSLAQLYEENPDIHFKGLTYFLPPIEPRSYTRPK